MSSYWLRCRVTAVLLAGAFLSGCGSVKGYPGPLRNFKDVAIVVGGSAVGGYGVTDTHKLLEIVAINGSERYEDWAGGTVRLLPGTYDFDVQYKEIGSSPFFGGLVGLAVDVARAADARETRRRIRFQVAAGRTYVVQYDTATREYAIADLYSAVRDPPAQLLAPAAGASRCVARSDATTAPVCELLPREALRPGEREPRSPGAKGN